METVVEKKEDGDKHGGQEADEKKEDKLKEKDETDIPVLWTNHTMGCIQRWPCARHLTAKNQTSRWRKMVV